MAHRNRIARITTWIAGAATIVFTLLLPAGYFAMSHQHMVGILESEAEIYGRIVSGLISTNPDMWQYEQIRLQELLERRPLSGEMETRRILNSENRLVAESVNPLRTPQISRSHDLMDAGVAVGRIEISRSLSPLLLRSCLVAVIGLSMGVVMFVTLRILPIRAVIQAEKALWETNKALQEEILERQRISDQVNRLNEELEEKVAQLETALAKVKQLEGIIPICSYCKRIRNDQQSWQHLENYISEHSEALFSHGVCPECLSKVTAEIEDILEKPDSKG